MDHQAALRQKDLELEERANLLLKTKVAIEQLQEELSSSRRLNETQKRAAEQQALQLRDTEQHLRLVEGELEGKTKECTELFSEVLALKRRLQELQDGLSSSSDRHASELGGLQARLREQERAAAAARAEVQAAQQQATALQAAVTDRGITIQSQAGRLAALEQSCAAQQASLAGLETELAAAQQARQAVGEALAQEKARGAEEAAQLGRRVEEEVAARHRAEAQAAGAAEALAAERERSAGEGKAWDRRLQALQEEWASKLERSEGTWAAKHDKLAAESQAALEEGRREWTRKFYLAEGEWFKKLQLANQDWAAKLEGVGREWMQRYDADRVKWEEERALLQRGFEERQHTSEAAHAAVVEEVKQHHRRKVVVAEAKVVADVRMLERVWVQRLEAANASADQERAELQRSWEAAAAEQEAAAQQALTGARQAGQAALAEAQAGWAAQLAAEERRWLEERHALERQWAEKLHATEKAASEAQAALRTQIEARLAAVTQRVAEMAQREARREARRSELLRQVAELRAVSEDEHRKRSELESALREASAIFKRELQDKNEQLDLLRREIRHVRTWEPLHSLDYGQEGPPASARIFRPATRLAHCQGQPASAGAAATRGGRPFSSMLVGHNSCMAGDGAISPMVLSQVRPSSAAAKAAQAAEKEAAALRAARISYQQALLEQQEERTALLRSINDALKEGIPSSASPAVNRRGKWKLGVATKLQDVLHGSASTPSSPLGAGHSPATLRTRPHSAGAAPAVGKAACRVGAEVLCSLMLPQQQQSYNTAADELGAVETGRANPAVLNISADATATAQGASRGGSALSDSRDLREWHDQLASRVGRAVSRLQQLSSEGQ